MRVIGASAFTAAVALSSSAAAAGWHDWKDGCPAKFPPELATTYSYIPNAPFHDGSGAFGTLPEPDSPLGGTRIAIDGNYTRLTPTTPDGRPDQLYTGQLLAQLSLASGPMLSASLPFGVTAGDESTYAHTGNGQLYLGYRHTGYLLGPAFRYGTAIRLGGGGELYTPSERLAALSPELEQMATLSPFNARSFTSGREFTFTVEQRLELTGCHQPFLDLAHRRVDMGGATR